MCHPESSSCQCSWQPVPSRVCRQLCKAPCLKGKVRLPSLVKREEEVRFRKDGGGALLDVRWEAKGNDTASRRNRESR